jgi:hypothetical protein
VAVLVTLELVVNLDLARVLGITEAFVVVAKVVRLSRGVAVLDTDAVTVIAVRFGVAVTSGGYAAATARWRGRVLFALGEADSVGLTVSRIVADARAFRIASLVLEAGRALLGALLNIRQPIVLSRVAVAFISDDRSALVVGAGIDDLAERNTLVWAARDLHQLVG